MRHRSTAAVAALVALAVAPALLGGCGGGDDDSSEPEPDGGVDIAATISTRDFSFDPDEATAGRGESVEWTNEGAVAHTITAEDDLFDSGAIEPGESFVFTFDQPGTYDYSCTIHPGRMQGTVTVER